MTPMSKDLSLSDWHARFQVQATWTQSIRHRLYEKAGLKRARQVLETGSGTGVLTAEMHSLNHARIYGLDLDPKSQSYARSVDPTTRLVQGDALNLPFADQSFDLTYCHYFLLWVHDPHQCLLEMARVTRSRHAVLALAEPDYGGRIDYPPELADLGKSQTIALEGQGANPRIGRELASLFVQAGLKNVVTGVLGGEWRHPAPLVDFESEWTTLSSDIHSQLDPDRIELLKRIDKSSWLTGKRVLFVPTFFAIGWIP